MDTHPGGRELTRELLKLAGIRAGDRVIDLGAGSGESISLLKQQGIDAVGIDRDHPVWPVIKGDMCALDYEREYFAAALAECSFSVCGDLNAAVAESARVLKNGGKLLISDIFYKDTMSKSVLFPYAVTTRQFKKLVLEHGLEILFFKDISEVLREYYIESVWNGTNGSSREEAIDLKKAKLGYFMMICKK